MAQRILYGALAIATILGLFAYDVAIAKSNWVLALDGTFGTLLRRGSMIPLLFLVAASLGAVEMLRLVRRRGAEPYARFALIMTPLIAITPWLSASGMLGNGPAQVEGLFWQIILIAASVLGVGLLSITRRSPDNTFRDAGATLTIILVLGFLASFGVQLRCGCDTPKQDGAWLLLIAVLVTKASDIGAFFVGTLLGKHKIAPHISPAKTIEGTVGGLLASACAAMLIVRAGMWANLWLSQQPAPHVGGPEPADANVLYESVRLLYESTRAFAAPLANGGLSPTVRALIFGLFMSVAGQIGDLFESCFKRDADVKDSGRVIPRFGGILDLVDSPLFSLPVAWVLLTVVWGLA